MPATIFNPGDLCNCHALVCNADGSVLEGYPLFVILNVFGDLFFAPSFDPGFDSYLATYPSFAVGLTDVEVLPDFFWPANSGDIVGVEWIAALTNPEITDIYGEWDIYEFGWTN